MHTNTESSALKSNWATKVVDKYLRCLPIRIVSLLSTQRTQRTLTDEVTILHEATMIRCCFTHTHTSLKNTVLIYGNCLFCKGSVVLRGLFPPFSAHVGGSFRR